MPTILAPVLRQRFFDSNGEPLAGGRLYSYQAGTSTPQATYTDQSGGVANANPVILDAAGEANIWLDPTLAYHFVLQDANGAQQWTIDQVANTNSGETPQWNVNQTYSAGAIVRDSSGHGLLYVSLTSNNTGNALTSVANWRMFDGRVRTITANETLAVTDNLVRSNSTSGNLTQTLPACSTTPIGKRITVKDVGTGGNTTSVRGNGTDTVDGNVTYATPLRANDSAIFINMGTRWDATGATTAAKNISVGSNVNFSTTSSSYDDTGASVTITTTGRPVFVGLIDGRSSISSGYSRITGSAAAGGNVQVGLLIERDGTGISAHLVAATTPSGALGVVHAPASSVSYIDRPAAGTYTYSLSIEVAVGDNAAVVNTAIIAYEL